MSIELPTQRREAQQYNPRLLVLFGKPKSGKKFVYLKYFSYLCNILKKIEYDCKRSSK